MKKYLILVAGLAMALIMLPRASQASIIGYVGKTSTFSNTACIISNTDRGTGVVKAVKLADAEAINNLYFQYWGRDANCEELQRHIDWGTPLGKLADWLNDSPHAVVLKSYGSRQWCDFSSWTTKDALNNLNNIYLEEAGRPMNCQEALFHLEGTTQEKLRNWIKSAQQFSEYQTWKQSFRAVEGATYRDLSKFWLIKDGKRHWIPDVPTMFAWGLIFDDSTLIDSKFREGFYNLVPEGAQLNFKDGKYKTAVKNRYKGSGYGTMPDKLETAIKERRSLYGSTWRGYAEFRSGYCSQEKYCTLK